MDSGELDDVLGAVRSFIRESVLPAGQAIEDDDEAPVGMTMEQAARLGSELVADRAVPIHSGAGDMRGVPVERMYRDARLFRIHEGTSSDPQQPIFVRSIHA